MTYSLLLPVDVNFEAGTLTRTRAFPIYACGPSLSSFRFFPSSSLFHLLSVFIAPSPFLHSCIYGLEGLSYFVGVFTF